MNSIQQKTPVIAGRGYSIRATGKPTTAPVALRFTPKQNFGVIRNEFLERE